MSKRAADAGAVAPHHLGEVTPCRIVVRVIVRVLGLLLVPAMGGGAGELNPSVVAIGRRIDGGEVASGAFLAALAEVHSQSRCTTHMFGVVGAFLDVCSRRVGQVRVPDQVLRAV
jgi:hypothetical protein